MIVLSTFLVLVCAPAALLDFAIPKWGGNENLRIEDAYKYLYQATRGGEHAAPDRDSAMKWLDSEWQSLGPAAKDEKVWEPLCPGGEIGRLNLRPLKARGGKADDLVNAFLRSAGEYRTEPATFIAAWEELGRRLKSKRIGNLDHEEWKRLDAEMKKKDHPAIHHSEQYNKAHRPAYRIITRTEMEKLLKNYSQ